MCGQDEIGERARLPLLRGAHLEETREDSARACARVRGADGGEAEPDDQNESSPHRPNVVQRLPVDKRASHGFDSGSAHLA